MRFPSFPRASLAALAAYAVVVSAFPSLTAETQIPNANATGFKNLKATLPENTAADAAGSRPSFRGAKVNYNTTHVASPGDPSAISVLPSGSPIDATRHRADGTPEGLYATPEGINKVRLSGDSAVPRSVHDKRASYVSCSHDQQEEIRKTIPVAQNSALMAYYHIYKMGTPTERYVRWFGFQDPHRREKTQRILGWVSATDFSSFQFNCTCDYAVVEKGTEAYTRNWLPGHMWLCEPFFKFPLNYRAGIFLHEVTHFLTVGGTTDHEYGVKASEYVAWENPDAAIDNADNYMYFIMGEHVTDVPKPGN